MTNVKQDLTLYKELKTIKSNFDKEMKTVKASIKVNNFSNAKSGLNNCSKYIDCMENTIDSLPDKSSLDIIKNLVPGIITILGGVIASSINNVISNKDIKNNLKEYYAIKGKYDKKEEDIKKKYDKEKTDLLNEKISLYDKNGKTNNKYFFDMMKQRNDNLNDKKVESLKAELDSLNHEYAKKMCDIEDKLYDIPNKQREEIQKNYLERNKELEKADISKKIYDRKVKRENTDIKIINAATITGITGTILSLRPLKSKAKSILKKCKKELDNTKAYLDKVEKMSKAVKESFDEALDSLYESFTEGAIDEFEYDTLVDHLLS